MKTTRIRFVLLALLLSVISCDIERPVTPAWDISGTFPLLNAGYTARSLIGKLNDPPLEITPAGDILFVYDTTYRSTFDIGDSLTIRVSDSARTKASRRLRIPKFEKSASQSLGNIAAASGITLPIGSPSVPRFDNLRSDPYRFELDDNIRFVDVAEGGIRVRVANGTGLRFEQLQLELQDLTQNALLGTLRIPSLNAGQTVLDSILLNNRRFTNRLAIRITDGRIPAQASTIVPAAPLTITIQPTDTIAYTAAEVRFQAQAFLETGTVRATGGVIERLRSVTLRRGGVTIRFINPVAINGTAKVVLPTVTQGTRRFEEETFVPALQTAVVTLSNLGGWTINAQGDTVIPYQITARTNEARDFIRIDPTTEFVTVYQTERIAAARAEGVVWRVDENRPLDFNFTLDPLEVNLSNVDTLSGQLFPELTLDFRSSIGFLVRATTRFVTFNDRRRDSLDVLLENRPITLEVGPNATTRLSLNASNSNIAQIFTRLPNRIITRGSAVLNPNRTFGFVTDTSSVSVALRFRMPFRFNLAAFGLRDTLSLSPPDLSNVQAARLALQVQSGFPINTRLRTVFLNAAYRPVVVNAARQQVLSVPRTGFATIAAAPVSATGESIALTPSSIVLELSDEELRALPQARYVFLELQADTRQGAQPQLARVRASDVLQLRAIVQGTYRIGSTN